MLMKTKSLSDQSLLFAAGFVTQYCELDQHRAAAFFCVSVRTIQRWVKDGLPPHARVHLENLMQGDYLPDTWRRAGIKISHDRVYLHDGRFMLLESLRWWPYIAPAVDWSKVPPTSAPSLR